VSESSIAWVGREDLDELLPLIRAYCDFYNVAPSDRDLTTLSGVLIDDPEHEGLQLIARDANGRAAGFATIYWTWSTTDAARIGVMNDLFVAESARGQGVAERLIEACRAECAQRGARRLTWQTAPDNFRAQAVYDRVGGNREQWVDYWLSS
jgi:GNAT superfamily N-acetyltransferase